MKYRSIRAFTLLELAIVMMVIGSMLAGIWTVTASVREKTRVSQSFDALTILTDMVRSTYFGQNSIIGGVSVVVPQLISRSGIPTNMRRPASAACSNASGCLDTAWGGSPTAYPNGTLGVCSWNYGTDVACATAGSASNLNFAIQFSGLSYGSCLVLAQGVSNTTPRGLIDIYINNNAVAASGGLPASSTTAAADCTKGSYANVIDYVYSLR